MCLKHEWWRFVEDLFWKQQRSCIWSVFSPFCLTLVRKELLCLILIFTKFFQITNGGSAFSIELAELLRTKHGCQSILLETQAKHTENSFKRTSNGIPTINCNPLDNAELAQLSKLLEREYGGNIDVIIDNGISNISKEIRQNCDIFVDYTSERLRVTINVWYDFFSH